MHKALRTFSGLISMKKGEIRDLKNVDKYIIEDLIKANYIEENEKEIKAIKKR